MRLFRRVLHQPNLWHLNRRSVARACALGFFWACVPMPFQMIPAGVCAVWLRANMAIVFALTWLSNPLTWAPQVYGMYRVGRLFVPRTTAEQAESGQWVWAHLSQVWEPFLAGFVICTAVLTVGSYIAVRLLWRWHIAWTWRRRKLTKKGISTIVKTISASYSDS